MSSFIEIKDLHFSYVNDLEEPPVKTEVLKGINLNIEKGEFVAVLGHNGSGKSTLAKCINAINLPESGAVYVNGMDTLDENNLLPIREKVGMVFQNPDNQIVATIVEEDVAFALENMGVEPNEIRRRVDEALKTVGMYEYRLHAPHKLSGGQKQRVAIAGIIAMKPDCILLDEPTAMLDPHGRDEVMKTVKMLNEQGVTIVLITHYMEEAAQAQRVVVIDGGEVIMDNVPKKIFSNVETMKNLGLDVPQVTELCWELKRAGYDISTEIIHEDDMTENMAEASSQVKSFSGNMPQKQEQRSQYIGFLTLWVIQDQSTILLYQHFATAWLMTSSIP